MAPKAVFGFAKTFAVWTKGGNRQNQKLGVLSLTEAVIKAPTDCLWKNDADLTLIICSGRNGRIKALSPAGAVIKALIRGEVEKGIYILTEL